MTSALQLDQTKNSKSLIVTSYYKNLVGITNEKKVQKLVFSHLKMCLDFDKTLKVVHQTTNRKKFAFFFTNPE